MITLKHGVAHMAAFCAMAPMATMATAETSKLCNLIACRLQLRQRWVRVCTILPTAVAFTGTQVQGIQWRREDNEWQAQFTLLFLLFPKHFPLGEGQPIGFPKPSKRTYKWIPGL